MSAHAHPIPDAAFDEDAQPSACPPAVKDMNRHLIAVGLPAIWQGVNQMTDGEDNGH